MADDEEKTILLDEQGSIQRIANNVLKQISFKENRANSALENPIMGNSRLKGLVESETQKEYEKQAEGVRPGVYDMDAKKEHVIETMKTKVSKHILDMFKLDV